MILPIRRLAPPGAAGIANNSESARCGVIVAPDDRPHDFTYIVEAILAPTCGTATCHSTLSKEAGYMFDTVDNARATFNYYSLTDPGSPDDSELIEVLTAPRFNDERMPRAGPMPDKDIDLLRAWITDGAVTQ